jgi:FKBP-type peptidyl-prolyl cis-trans isomerase (trigger factor)
MIEYTMRLWTAFSCFKIDFNLVSSEVGEMENNGIEKYIDSQEIDVPRDLFEEELRLLLIEEAHRVQYGSFVTGQYEILTPEEKRDSYEELKKIAYRNVKAELLIKNIIETQRFEVTREELEEEALGISERQNVTMEQIKDFFGEELSALRRDILAKKAEKYIRSLT